MVRRRTLGETQQEADALEDIAKLVVKYFPPDSGVSCRDVVNRVIEILETKSGPIFERLYPSEDARAAALQAMQHHDHAA